MLLWHPPPERRRRPLSEAWQDENSGSRVSRCDHVAIWIDTAQNMNIVAKVSLQAFKIALILSMSNEDDWQATVTQSVQK